MLGLKFKNIIYFLLPLTLGCSDRESARSNTVPPLIMYNDLGSFAIPDDLRDLNTIWTDLKDTDNDGVPDRVDSDIDNDSIPNFIDEFPFDSSKGGEDLNKDGLPDFVEFRSDDPILSELLVNHQKKIFEKFGIYVVSQGKNILPIVLSELEFVLDQLLGGFSKEKVHQFLSVIVYTENPSEGRRTLGEYNKEWTTILLSEYQDHLAYMATLTHELFHVLKHLVNYYHEFLESSRWIENTESCKMGFEYAILSNPISICITHQSIENDGESIASRISGDDFPSDYSKFGPEEMFAESGAVSYLLKNTLSNPEELKKLYPYLDKFLNSKNHRRMNYFLDELRACQRINAHSSAQIWVRFQCLGLRTSRRCALCGTSRESEGEALKDGPKMRC